MSKLAGYSVLALGVLGLGGWGMAKHAQNIEEQIGVDAQAIAQGVTPPLEVSVSGRDITVSGLVESTAQADTVQAAFDGIEGRRVLRTDLRVPEVADPHQIVLTRGADGVVKAQGMVAAGADRAELAQQLDLSGLDLRQGAVEGWAQAVQAGSTALIPLESGQVELSGDQMTISGVARDPVQHALAIAALDAAPDTVQVSTDISELDDGAPFVFTASKGDGLALTGKLPLGLDLDGLNLGGVDLGDLELPKGELARSGLEGPEGYGKRISVGLEALSEMEDGALEVNADGLRLSGSALNPDAEMRVRRALSGMPDAAPGTVEIDLTVLDDGEAFVFSASKADLFSAHGKLPADVDISGFDIPVADIRHSGLAGPDGYGANVTAGLSALSLLDRGELNVDATGLHLTGTVADADAQAAALAALPEGATAAIEIPVAEPLPVVDPQADAEVAQDDTAEATPSEEIATETAPATDSVADADATAADPVVEQGTADAVDPVFTWSIDGGVTQSGAFAPDAVQAALRGEAADLGDAAPALAALAPWMPNVEGLSYGPDGLDVTVAAGVDADQVRDALAAELGDVPVSVQTVGTAEGGPADGTERVNQFTGETEIYQGGFWIPRLDFSPSRESCAAQADMVLGRGEITFLSGSATLDARATRAVNLLSSVLRRCGDFTQAGIEIGGHTDSTGDAALNQQLSQDRAQAVVAALASRGVNPDLMTARGYGADMPIADNATEEGRAANRRTTITWAE